MKKIIGIVGEKLAGKDVMANYLVKKYGAQHFRFSHILDDILVILNLEISRRNEIDLGLGLRKVFGDDVLVTALKKRAEAATSDLVVVNGIRLGEFDIVKSWPGAKVVYVTAPAAVRFERYQQRHQKADDAIMDFEQFVAQEKELTEVGIPALGARADFRIDNTGTLEEFYKKIDEVVGKLK